MDGFQRKRGRKKKQEDLYSNDKIDENINHTMQNALRDTSKAITAKHPRKLELEKLNTKRTRQLVSKFILESCQEVEVCLNNVNTRKDIFFKLTLSNNLQAKYRKSDAFDILKAKIPAEHNRDQLAQYEPDKYIIKICSLTEFLLSNGVMTYNDALIYKTCMEILSEYYSCLKKKINLKNTYLPNKSSALVYVLLENKILESSDFGEDLSKF